MKHFYKAQQTIAMSVILMISLLLVSSSNFAQSIANYQAGFSASTGTFTPISGGTAVPSLLDDDGTQSNIPIGFTFWYMGNQYTQVRACSNGWISLNPSNSINAWTNNLTTVAAANAPLIAPFWDDLGGYAAGSAASYITTGTAPNRVFTFEWLNWEWQVGSGTEDISFQVKLYEGTGKIEFIYRDEPNAGGGSASIGLTGLAAGSYVALNNSTATPTASTSTNTTNIGVEPATNQVYSFLPPSPLAATTLVATATSATQVNLTWTDNATNELVYIVQYSSNPTFATSTISTYAANTVNASITGLIPNTTYYFNVIPVAEVPGTPATASATTPDIPKTINTFNIVQASTGGVTVGTVNQSVLRADINVIGSMGSLPLNSFAASSLNTDEADISAIKLYVTTNTTFAATTLLASATSFSSGVVSFLGLNYDLPQGNTYLWLTYDIAPTAVFGNIIDAQIDANFIDINGTGYPASTANPTGILWVDQYTTTSYGEDFEPSGMASWTSANFYDETDFSCSGSSLRYNLYAFATSATLTSPVIGLVGNTVTTLSYDYKIVDWNDETNPTPNDFGNFVAQWSNAPGGPWTTFHTVASDHIPSASCVTKVATFTPTAGNLYVRFVATWANGDYYLYFDNIGVANIIVAQSAISADNVKPGIVYTPLSNDVVSASRSLPSFAQITDSGTGVDATPGNRPRVYYKKNTEGPGFDPLNDNTVDGWKWVESSNTTSPFDFTIDYNKLMSPVVDGDIIQYFVVAQDSLRYPAFPAGGNVASNVSGGFVGTSVSNITTAPTTPLTYMIAPSIGPVTYTISSTGDYPSITNGGGLFEAINNSVVVGDITAIIAEDLSGETGDNGLNVFGNGSHKLSIMADGTGLKTISGNSTSHPNGMIRFNGASNVIIDGGASQELTFINDATNSAVLSFMNDCSNDSITNVTIEGSLTNANSGLILIGTGYQVGNKNLSFTNNRIKENSLVSGPYSNGIYSQGSSASMSNEMIVIQNNDFVNFTANGINVTATGNGNGWLIKDNDFYNDGIVSLTTAATAINFKSGGNNNEISGNMIGGSGAGASGLALATTANFTGIDVAVGNTSLSTSITNNTIKNIRSTVNTTGLTNNLLNVSAGSVFVKKNTIGSNDINERIELNGNNAAININTSAECVVDSNTVANITSVSTSTDDWDRAGIIVGGSATKLISNNTVHHVTNTDKSVGGNEAVTYGIVTTSTGETNIVNNTIHDIKNSNTANTLTVTNKVAGILVIGSGSNSNVANNKIYGLSGSTNAGALDEVSGIIHNSGVLNIVNNSISISSNDSSVVRGILSQSTVATNLANNTIYIGGTTSTNASSHGILRSSSATIALRNNLIYNNRTSTAGTASHLALANTNGTPASGWSPVSSSNNAFIVGDATKVGEWGAGNIVDEAGLSSTFGETGSQVVLSSALLASDLFIDANGTTPNLNIDETKPGACMIANIGTPVAGLTVDMDGVVRSTTTPDPGAYEFDGLLPGTVSAITGASVGCAGASPINFSVNTVTNATDYIWSFTSGITMASTGIPTEAIQVNVAPGTNDGIITIIAKNGCGESNSEFKYVSFDNAIPTASFSSSTAAAGVAVELFTSNSTDATSYDWNFGDGNTSTLESPTHSYTANGPFTVTLTVSNACGTDTETKTVQFTVGSQELANKNVSMVSPNPTTDRFVLVHNSTTDKTISVEVSNIAGQTVYSHNVENYNGSYKQEISLSGNANGVYFVKVISDNKTTTHKLILNN